MQFQILEHLLLFLYTVSKPKLHLRTLSATFIPCSSSEVMQHRKMSCTPVTGSFCPWRRMGTSSLICQLLLKRLPLKSFTILLQIPGQPMVHSGCSPAAFNHFRRFSPLLISAGVRSWHRLVVSCMCLGRSVTTLIASCFD